MTWRPQSRPNRFLCTIKGTNVHKHCKARISLSILIRLEYITYITLICDSNSKSCTIFVNICSLYSTNEPVWPQRIYSKEGCNRNCTCFAWFQTGSCGSCRQKIVLCPDYLFPKYMKGLERVDIFSDDLHRSLTVHDILSQ